LEYPIQHNLHTRFRKKKVSKLLRGEIIETRAENLVVS